MSPIIGAEKKSGYKHADNLGFLLSQVGDHAAQTFGKRLYALGLRFGDVTLMRELGRAEGQSQQALGDRIGMFSSNLVGFVDRLEQAGLVEKRKNSCDRRTYALYLTATGRAVLAQIDQLAAVNDKELLQALSRSEVNQLKRLLQKLAFHRHLKPRIHPAVNDQKP